jgi:aldose 1-epimerase
MKRILSVLVLLGLSLPARGADLKMATDAESGLQTIGVARGDTAIKVAPEAGANVFSIRFKGIELLKQPKSLKDLPGFMYGVPVLYPTPNRVRGGVFTFGGQKFSFPPNDHGNFLHGLVHSAAWRWHGIENSRDLATATLELPFAPGAEQYKLFPIPHALQLAIRVAKDSVRWTYTVDNRKGDKSVPYGFALHPWFLYQGARKDTFVTIPATHVMEATKDMLPTGKLIDLAAHSELDAREPRSLEGFVRDDVYFGTEPSRPAVIDFRGPRLKITLSASEQFNHLVLYSPKGQPWFCLEDQTCSTDAHNLFAQGLRKESNLLVVEPGKTATGWIEFRFANY